MPPLVSLPNPKTPIPFEPNGLYLVLLGSTKATTTWHWALYLAITTIGGRMFHLADVPFIVPSSAEHYSPSQQLPPTPPPTSDAFDLDLQDYQPPQSDEPPALSLSSLPCSHSLPHSSSSSSSPHSSSSPSPSSSPAPHSSSAAPPSPQLQSRSSHWPPRSGEKMQRRLTFEDLWEPNMAFSSRFVLGLKVAMVEPPEDMHQPLAERLERVPIREGDTSRSWTMEALRQLDNEGWVALGSAVAGGIKDTIDLVEEEAADAAHNNSMRNQRSTETSRFFRG